MACTDCAITFGDWEPLEQHRELATRGRKPCTGNVLPDAHDLESLLGSRTIQRVAIESATSEYTREVQRIRRPN